jgi:putative two-component system response regulator
VSEQRAPRIVIVDDEPANVLLIRRVLTGAGFTNVGGTARGAHALQLVDQQDPDLLVLDWHMPGLDGAGVIEKLAERAEGARPAVIVVTADANEDTKHRALAAGADDVLNKPFDNVELVLRVRNLLQSRDLQRKLTVRNESLEQRVRAHTAELEESRLEILDRLARAAEFRDDDTNEHAQRIGRTASVLARALGLPEEAQGLIARAAPLHDVGKIGVPDDILLKPGALTEQEIEVMRRHTTIGAQMLSGSRAPVLQMAERIALTHHERWDGAGYPQQLAGEEIPIEGRIVAVADVFDALVHDSPYKLAWPVDRAALEIGAQAGHHFDPDVAAAFAELNHQALLLPVAPPAEHGAEQALSLTS